MEENEDMIIYKRTNFGKRLGAFLIDGVVLLVLGYVFGLILGKPTPIAPEELMGLPFGEMMLKSLSVDMTPYYLGLAYALIEIFVLKSPGKMILGLIIGNQAGEKPPTSALVVRYLLKQASTLLFLIAIFSQVASFIWVGFLLAFVYLVGCLVATSQNRLALHDIIAKTAVYDEKMLEEA
jgi:uncharacterized RDD family membrane protein YckC